MLITQPISLLAAKIVVDKAALATQQASLNQAANGVPIVEITKPSAGGVSMNAFSDYNVGKEGVILNNSADIVQTQLGGYIDGNAHFSANDRASLIVNQVSSQSQSQLNGYTEVGGHQAAVIIANPNGISCDGCGFINTSHGTLTTGTVHLNQQGLDYIDVRKGKITIDGQGLNATNLTQADIIARAIEINADVYGDALQLIAGQNLINNKGVITALTSSDNKPQLAIHLGNLSSVFANDIQMIATEKGVGVFSEAYVEAAHAFTLNADGKITLNEALAAGQSLNITSEAIIENNATLYGQKILNLHAPEIHNNGSIIQSSETGIQNINEGNGISINADTLNNRGEIISENTLDLNLNQQLYNEENGVIRANQGLTINLSSESSFVENKGNIFSEGDFLKLNVDSLNNKGNIEIVKGGQLAINHVFNQGSLLFWQTEALDNDFYSLDNHQGVLASYSNNWLLNIEQNLNNQEGKIIQVGGESGALNVHAATLNNTAGLLVSDYDLTIDLKSQLNNQQGIISTQHNMFIDALSIDNASGKLTSQSDIKIAQLEQQSDFVNSYGEVNALNTMSLSFNSAYVHSGTSGMLQGGIVDLRSIGFTLAEDWSLRGDLVLESPDLQNQDSAILIEQGKKLHTAGTFTIESNSITIAEGAELKSADQFLESDLSASHNIVNEGLVSAANSLRISANNFYNEANAVGVGANHLSFTIGDQIINQSLLYANQFLELFSSNVINQADIYSAGDILIAESIDNSRAQYFYNENGHVSAQENIYIYANSIINESSEVNDADIAYSFVKVGTPEVIMAYTGFDINENKFFPEKISDIESQGQHNSTQKVTQQAVATFTGDNFLLASIDAGKNLLLDAGDEGVLKNIAGRLSAIGNIDIYAKRFENSSIQRKVNTDIRTDYFYTVRADAGTHRNFFLTTANYDDYADCTMDSISCYKPYYTTQSGTKKYIDVDTFQLANSIYLAEDLYVFILMNRYTGQSSSVLSATPYGVLANIEMYGDRITKGIVLGDEDGFSEVSDRYISRYEEQRSNLQNSPVYAGSISKFADVKGIANDGLIKAGLSATIHAQEICNGQVADCAVSNTVVADISANAGIDSSTQEPDAEAPVINVASDEIPNSDLPVNMDGSPRAINPLDYANLVNGGLFSYSNNPEHPYLVETNPLLTDYKNFISSDYLFSKIDWDADAHTKRIGDGYYELSLIEEALRQVHNSDEFSLFKDASTKYQYLMDNAAVAQEDLQLAVGMSLTKEQINQLNASIVWMEYRIVKGEKVLVPIVYLLDVEVDNVEGALIAAKDIYIEGGRFDNQANLKANNYLQLALADKVNNYGGSISSGGYLRADIGGDFYNSGQIKAARARFNVAGNIVHETQVQAYQAGDMQGSLVSEIASISTTQGDLIQHAGGDFVASAANIMSAGNNQISANNINIKAIKMNEANKIGSGKNFSATQGSDYLTSHLSSQDDLLLQASNSILSEGAKLNSEQDIFIVAERGNIDLQAVEQYHKNNTERAYSSGPSYNQTKKTLSEQDTQSVFTGTSLNAAGNLIINAGKDISLMATKAQAGEYVQINSAGSVSIDSLVNTETSRTKSTAKSKTSFKNVDKGIIAQDIEYASIQAGKGLSINGEQGVNLRAAELSTQGNLILNAQTIKKDEEGNALVNKKEQYMTENNSLANVHSDTLKLTNESWNEVEKGKRGIAADIAKVGAVIETGLKDLTKYTGVNSAIAGIKGESMEDAYHKDSKSSVTISEKNSVKETKIKEVGSQLNASNIAIKADNLVQLTNATITAGSENAKTNKTIKAAQGVKHTQVIKDKEKAITGIVQIEAKDILLDAKADTSEKIVNHSSEIFTAEGQKIKGSEWQLAAAENTKTSNSSTQKTANYTGTTINANAISLEAENTLALLSTDISAELLKTKAQDTQIGGYQDTQSSTSKERVETERVSLGVRNAYVDTALAANEITHAVEALDHAKDAYQDAKSLVAQGKMSASELKYHEANIAAATMNVANAEIAFAQTGATAAATTATAGFTLSGNSETRVSESQNKNEQAIWNGSNIQAGMWSAEGLGDNSKINIEGSKINVSDTLSMNIANINLHSGVSTSKNSGTSTNDSLGSSAKLTNPSGGSVNASAQNTSNKNNDLVHTNTTIQAGNFNSTSDTLVLEGASVLANNLNINTKNLSVISVQDQGKSENQSEGYNLGFGVGVNDKGANINGPSIGGNNSEGSGDKRWVQNQSMLIGSQSANISAENTTLTGGVIANAVVDSDGRVLSDQGHLNFSTQTLVLNDLVDTDTHQQTGFSASTRISQGSHTDTSTGKVTEFANGSSTLGADNNGYDKEQLTLATLGAGTVTVGGENINNTEHANINRDVEHSQIITKDLITGGLNADVTIDHRLYSEEGIKDIKEDNRQTGIATQTLGNGIVEVTKIDNPEKNKVLFVANGVTENVGGLLAETPVLVGQGDIENKKIQLVSGGSKYMEGREEDFEPIEDSEYYKTLAPEKQNELKNKNLYVTKDNVQIKFDTATYQNFTNGMLNDAGLAIINGMQQSTETDKEGNIIGDIAFTLNYNPTHGIVSDLVESGLDKSGIWTTGIAKQTGEFVRDVIHARAAEGSNFNNHSQGNVLFQSGVEYIHDKGSYENGGFDTKDYFIDKNKITQADQEFGIPTAAGFGSPVNTLDMNNTLRESDFISQGMFTHADDFVGEGIGGNMGENNQATTLDRLNIINIKKLSNDHSPHSTYHCSEYINAKCGEP